MQSTWQPALNAGPQLNNGISMPWLGLGVYKARNGEEEQAIQAAIELGYRAIDTATFYQNEDGVGRAIRNCGLPREELFVTTKMWNDQQGYENTLKAFEASRKLLGLEVVDLYLVHWPVRGKFRETWKALVHLYEQGSVRAIGVSNFEIEHLEMILKDSPVLPVVNQIELHPLLTRKPLLEFCAAHNIRVTAWSPLMRGQIDLPLVHELAQKYGKTAAQIILRWDHQNGVIVIPKSVHRERIAENAGIFDFEINSEDMQRIDRLNQDRHVGTTYQDVDALYGV